MKKLQTERLILRPYTENDVNEHFRLMSDPTIMRYLPDLRAETLAQSRDNLLSAIEDMIRDDPKQQKFCFFIIEEKASGNYIGELGYTVDVFAPQGKEVGLGYFIHEEYWGKGYTTEAVRELFRYAFEEDGVYRISSGCLKENVGSERVMIKSGMIKEGELKEFQLHEGVLSDRLIYRMLKSDWDALK